MSAPQIPGAPGLVEPAGPKITFTIEIWQTGEVRTNCEPPASNGFAVLHGLLSACFAVTETLAKMQSMLVNPRKGG